MGLFTKYIFNLFPSKVRKEDSYKWPDGRGFLQRYLSAFEDELDANVLPYIDNVLDLVDALKVDSKYLADLSYNLGSPAQVDSSLQTYRLVLEYAVAMWRVKGTKKSYKMLFDLMGLEVDIIEGEVKAGITYDQPGVNYDAGYTYDQDFAYCSKYKIAYNSKADTTNPFVHNPVDNSTINLAQKIISQIEPINARFDGFIRRIRLREVVDITINESYSIL